MTSMPRALYGLDRVEVGRTESGIDIAVYVGHIPGATDCSQQEVFVTTVVLDEALVEGGRSDE